MDPLSCDWDGDVAVLRWDDGENRFNIESVEAWHRALDELESRDGPLAVVVTGAGKFFSNGLDLARFQSEPDSAGATVSRVHRLLGRMLLFPAYTVAAIGGHAFAAGAMLTCCFDVRLMRRDRGFWCLPEVDLGLPLTDAMHAAVTARLPGPAAEDAILTGRRYGGDEAARRGIVHEALDADAVLPRAVELAAEMASKDRSVIQIHKRQLFGAAAAACGWPEA